MSTEFYRCPICGNVIIKLVDSGVTPHCCGEEMELLDANTFDGAKEKHVPQVVSEGNDAVKVMIGEVPHPMSDAHYIKVIYLEAKQQGHDTAMIAWLNPDDKAEHIFRVKPSEVKSVYEYCNLHGLWVKKQ